tara:strand:- start:157 stop:327 length:171 start_codon:yes stop_codon:yes gene_type:complete
MEIGLNYTEIQDLSTMEATMLLAMNASFSEYKQEQLDRNAKHQQAASSHPTFPKGY